MPSPAKAVELEDAPAKRRVLVVDDHPLFRRGVVQLLTDEPDLEVRAEANTSNEALGAIRRQRFDLAVVDIGEGRPQQCNPIFSVSPDSRAQSARGREGMRP